MKKTIFLPVLLLVVAVKLLASDPQDPGEKDNSCLTCHRGIEKIRPLRTQMMRNILRIAEKSGTGNRCIVCHGGNPAIKRSNEIAPGSEEYRQLIQHAHQGTNAYFQNHPGPKQYYPDPSSPWINADSCGQCHQWQVQAQWKSLMMTEAGKIQGTTWSFGGLSGYEHQWSNYDVATPADPKKWLGSTAYRSYLKQLRTTQANVFRDKMTMLPPAPQGGVDITRNPELAAYTYIRGECQRCHLAVRGKQRYGDYRGMGCSGCHMPYSNNGLYEGEDQAMPKTKVGVPLVHSLQATEKSPVKVGAVTYRGIPVETCTTCHNRGRRIGVSYQGLMESPYPSPWNADGKPQQRLHGKNYIPMQPDIHKRQGFFCQDCHTTLDVHSDNTLIGAITGAVEIECQDCHGTPAYYPWELPLGFSDEYRESAQKGPGRGLSQKLPGYMEQGVIHPREDGYLLTARGNPFGNVVKKGDKVIVYLASGEKKELSPLKLLASHDAFSLDGRVAMTQVEKHIDRLECYSCHCTWAPQCYGCHLKIDYSSQNRPYDWVELGHQHFANGLTKEYTPEGEKYRIAGEIIETRSYLRWENPALAQNGEGRIAPVVPGCQASITVINKQGQVVIRNHIFRVKNAEGGGRRGQLAIDMAPLFPHTVQKRARKCESCHNDPKTLGYGITSGALAADPSVPHYVDLLTADGKMISQKKIPQIAAIPDLPYDWSRFVSETGKQLQTVGHHFQLSRPLNNTERRHIERQGICLSCHKELPNRSLAAGLLHHVGIHTGMLPKTNQQHSALVNKTVLLAAWIQVLAMLGGIVFGLAAFLWGIHKWRNKKR